MKSAASPSRGSMKVGSSEDYKALLRGEITSEEYVKRLKALVDRREIAEAFRRGRVNAHRSSETMARYVLATRPTVRQRAFYLGVLRERRLNAR